jgi:hypothetical protein
VTIRRVGPVPILIAAIGPKNVSSAGRGGRRDSPYLWSPSRWETAWGEALARA